MAKSKFANLSNAIVKSINDGIRHNKNVSFENMTDEKSHSLGVFHALDYDFYALLNEYNNSFYLTLTAVLPLSDEYIQSYRELNHANDEIEWAKISYNVEDNLIGITVSSNIKVVEDNKYVSLLLVEAMDVILALKKIKEQQLLKGAQPYLDSISAI